MDYFPGIFLIFSALLGLRSRFVALVQARKSGQSGGRLRLFIFSSLGSLGTLLVGASILLGKLNHPWKSGLGFFGSVLILFAIVRRIANAAADYLRKRFPPGGKDIGIGTLLGWIAGSTTGSFLGIGIALTLLLVASNWLGPLSTWNSLIKVIMRGAAGAVVGLLVGVLQLRVLSPYLPESRRWIWATIGGFALAFVFAEMIAIDTNLESREGDARAWIELIQHVIMGGSLGIFQRRIFQRWSHRAGWWPMLSALASVTGYVAIELLLPRASRVEVSRYLGRELVSDVVESIVTGVGLLWLQQVKVSPSSISSVFPSPITTNKPAE
jgi:hypothetical protein